MWLVVRVPPACVPAAVTHLTIFTSGPSMRQITVLGIAICALSINSLSAQESALRPTEGRVQELISLAAQRVLNEQIKTTTETGSLLGSGQQTGQVVRLTLDDAVAVALERNLDIAVERLNPQIEDISIASVRSVYYPSLTSQIGRANQTSAPTSQLQLSSGGFGVTTKTTTYNAAFGQSLPWGGASLDVSLTNDRQTSNSNNAFYNPRFQSVWSATYTQPLLRNFGIDGTRQQLRVTRLNRDISDVQLRATVNNTVSDVRNAYWDYVFAVEAVEVARQSLDLATKLVQDNEVRVEVGTMAVIDVVQAQSEAATRRQAVVEAETTRRTAELALKQLIVDGTEDQNWSASLDPVDRPVFSYQPVDIEAVIRRALNERSDLETARMNARANDVTVKYLDDQKRPQIDLLVTYGAQGVGGPYQQRSDTGVIGSEITSVVPGGIGDAFSTLFGSNYPRWTVQLNVGYALGASAQEAAAARARVQLQQVRAQIKQIELQVATEVTSAALRSQSYAEAVEAAQAARELAQRRLDAEQQKFQVGMSTNYFVVQAQRDLADAQNSELRAVLNYRKALVELERLQQTTLNSSNVTVVSSGGDR